MKKLLPPFILTFLLAMVLLSEGCYYDNAEDLYPTDTVYVTDTTGGTDSGGVSWATEVKPIIDANCAIPGCHVQNNDPRQPLTNYDQVKNAIDNWQLKLKIETGAMPPTGPLPAQEEAAILDWIDEGYPDN